MNASIIWLKNLESVTYVLDSLNIWYIAMHIFTTQNLLELS